MIDRNPREWGYQATVWTARLLVQYLAEVHHLSVSRASVSLALRRLRMRWKRPRHQLARRSPTWRQAKRGLKHRLATRSRTVLLMLDETIITETPPLYSCYGRTGTQVRVPITGNHAKRILHGVLNVRSGDVLWLITEQWVQETHQAFLRVIGAHWHGWQVVLFEDWGSLHTAAESRELARDLALELRFWPTATPELNTMDQLWRRVKGYTVANRATQTIEQSVDHVCQYILALRPHERLRQTGILSRNFC